MIEASSESITECGSEFISAALPLSVPNFPGALIECLYFPEHYCDQLFVSLGIYFPEEIQQAVTKRKAEFIAGRYCAQKALYQIGHGDCQVPIGTQRSPKWPEGVRGAITHAGNRAICALSKESAALGIDYELPIPHATAIEIQNNIITEAEALRLSDIYKEISQWLTIAFSIKESLFKALYPTVKQYFDFLDAEIIHVDPDKKKISLVLVRTLCPEAKSGQVFHGTYSFHWDGIFTLIEY